MPLGSIEFKDALLKFEKDINDLLGDLYEAKTDDLPAARKKAIIAAGKKKLADYDALLGKLSPAQKTTANKSFAEHMATIRSDLAEIK